jgi:hypothetical protein
MDTRTDFLLQLLQKIGAPLVAAAGLKPHADSAGAEVMAALLSESVRVSISLSQSMNIKPDDGNGDSVRVALASLAAPLLAESYLQSGRVPSEKEGRRIAKALESVIAFADNFAPAAEHAQRLKTLDGTAPFFDPLQTGLYAMHAMVAPIAAISEFSFGQEATRLVQEVFTKLSDRAKQMGQNLGTQSNAMGELVLLQALAQIYANAHRAETKKMQITGDSGQGMATPASVWESFDRQVAMLDVLMRAMGGMQTESSSGQGGGGGGVAPDMSVAEQPAPQVQSQPAGGNPMSFFKKK